MALEYLGMLTFRLFNWKNRNVSEDKNENGDNMNENMKSDQVCFPPWLHSLGV